MRPAGDEHQLRDPGADERLDRERDHRPVVDRQQVLVRDPGERIEPRPGASRENHPFHGCDATGVRIGIALFEEAEELDFAGPWEVLAAWSRQWPDDGVEVLTVADTLEPVRCAKGLRVLPDATWETAGPL